MRVPLRSTLPLLLAACLPPVGPRDEPEAPLPNVVLFLADDMGMGDSSAYQDYTGNADAEQIATRGIEGLARAGVRFTDAHSSSSVCTASRYALLTGRYHWRTGAETAIAWGPWHPPLIERDRPTIASLLRGAGYATGMVGKWHLGLTYRDAEGEPASDWPEADLRQPLADGPTDHGFDYSFVTPRSHKASVQTGWVEGRMAIGATGEGPKTLAGFDLARTGSANFERARSFLDGHLSAEASRGRPFFLYYSANSNHLPHTPCEAIDGVPVAGAGRMVDGSRPPSAAERAPGARKLGLPNTAERADFVHENDVAVTRLVRFLESTDDPRWPGHKLAENTLFVFTSDNGSEKGGRESVGPFRGRKASIHEGGHRVPLVASWPAGGVGDGDAATAGRTSAALVGLNDLYATLAELVGAPLPSGVAEDSQSALALLTGGEAASRSALVLDYDIFLGRCMALRAGAWKLIVSRSLFDGGEVEPLGLFDLASNPGEDEERNLLEDPGQRERVTVMTRQLVDLHRRGRSRPQ